MQSLLVRRETSTRLEVAVIIADRLVSELLIGILFVFCVALSEEKSAVAESSLQKALVQRLMFVLVSNEMEHRRLRGKTWPERARRCEPPAAACGVTATALINKCDCLVRCVLIAIHLHART